jgi:hypothetical protein
MDNPKTNDDERRKAVVWTENCWLFATLENVCWPIAVNVAVLVITLVVPGVVNWHCCVIVSVDDADTVTEDTVLLPGTTPNVPDTEPLLSTVTRYCRNSVTYILMLVGWLVGQL